MNNSQVADIELLRIRPSTRKGYCSALRRFLAWLDDNGYAHVIDTSVDASSDRVAFCFRLDQLTDDHIKEYAAHKFLEDGVRASTLNGFRSAVAYVHEEQQQLMSAQRKASLKRFYKGLKYKDAQRAQEV